MLKLTLEYTFIPHLFCLEFWLRKDFSLKAVCQDCFFSGDGALSGLMFLSSLIHFHANANCVVYGNTKSGFVRGAAPSSPPWSVCQPGRTWGLCFHWLLWCCPPCSTPCPLPGCLLYGTDQLLVLFCPCRTSPETTLSHSASGTSNLDHLQSTQLVKPALLIYFKLDRLA